MTVLRVDPNDPDAAAIERAAAILRRGGLVAFPTETVYGLGANALDEKAVRRIFDAKRRPPENPLIVHVPEATAARDLVVGWPAAADRLARRFWPGPLTVILTKRPDIPDLVTAGLPTVAIRVPSNRVALALLRAVRLPIAAPSANPFTAVSPTTAAHVERGLGARVDLILDGGPTHVGIESTVVDLSGERPRLLRPGMVSATELESVLGPIAAEPLGAPPEAAAGRTETSPASGPADDDRERPEAAAGARPSPGLHPRHYAPAAEVRVFPAARAEEAAELARAAAAAGRRPAALLREREELAPAHAVHMPPDPAAYGRRLYAELHALDEAGIDLILIEAVPDEPAWAGIRDRLRRAAQPQG